MGVRIDRGPEPPIRATGDGLEKTYASLSDLGIDLEFESEREYVETREGALTFVDAKGHRYRILVMSLEVVLCIRVGLDFDARALKISRVRTGGTELVVEHYEGAVHRALESCKGSGREFALVVDVGTVTQGWLSSGSEHLESELAWLDFDAAWLSLADPAPPLGARDIFRGIASRFRRTAE